MTPVIALAALAALAVSAPLLTRRLGRDAGYVLAVGFLAVAGVLVSGSMGAVLGGGVVEWSVDWLPSLGVSLALRLDGVSVVFALVALGVGSLVMAYCARYVGDATARGPVYPLLTTFALAMVGLVLADDVVLLYVFWELTTLCSFALVSTAGAVAARPGRRALVITVAGGLALLVAAVLLATVTGTTRLSAVLAEPAVVLESPLALPIGALVVVAALTKSAQLPVHFWLPGAMVAMTPISAYLHAATMVKAGVYLLIRVSPLFAGQPAWSATLLTVGLATALTGAVMALREHDLKALLAQSTVSQLGLLVAAIGVGTATALAAALLHTMAHALFKATLFMLVGIIDKQTGRRDVRELSGLWRVMPWTAAFTGLAALSMAGVPPLLGFVSKEYLFQGFLSADVTPWAGPLAVGVAVLASALTFAYSARIVHGAFGGPTRQPELHDPTRSFLAPAAVAAVAALALGPAVALFDPLIDAATRASLPAADPPSVHAWHGLSPELVLSAVTIALGLLLFWQRTPVDRALRMRLPDGAAWFDRLHDGLLHIGAAVGRPDRTSALAPHLVRPLLALLLLAAVAVAGVDGLAPSRPTGRALDWPVVLLLTGTVAAAVVARSALAALGLVGLTGLVVAVWFLLSGAPDVALTLLLVEILTTVVAVLVLRRLPGELPRTPRWRALPAAGLAVALGAAAAAATAALTGRRGLSGAGAYHLESAVPETGGSNVVNTILVDFRATDTLGEAVVLGAAAVGLLALLGSGTAPSRTGTTPRAEERDGGLVLRHGARVLVPGMAVLSAWLLWRGHDAPGGGFIAALAAGIAVGVHQVAHGFPGLPPALRPLPLVGGGLLVSLGSGLVPVLGGDAFLTPYEVPVLSSVGIGSALVFDLGVLMLVLGLLVAAFDRLGAAGPGAPDDGTGAAPPRRASSAAGSAA
ncbi:hydrogen gas-evolving membrane-bound hydrogenase subunit E [Blastococcus sp. SYSU DS1024]